MRIVKNPLIYCSVQSKVKKKVAANNSKVYYKKETIELHKNSFTFCISNKNTFKGT